MTKSLKRTQLILRSASTMSKFVIIYGFSTLIKRTTGQDMTNVKSLCNIFKRRIMEKEGHYYYIESIDLVDGCFKCMRLYDSNGIKINFDFYVKKNLFFRFFMKDLDSKFKILSKEESLEVLNKFEESNNTLKIIYSIDKEEGLGSQPFIYMKYRGASQRQLKVEKILPEEIKAEHYDFNIQGDMITEVKNKEDNLEVLFTHELMKDPLENMPVALNVYYSYFKKTLNLVHLHALDERIDINNGFDCVHLEKTENPENVKNAKQNFNIIVLFRNFRVNKVYHKVNNEEVREIKIAEFNFKTERFVQINSIDSLHKYYAKIKKVPVGLLVDISTTTSNTSTSNINSIGIIEVSEGDCKVDFEKLGTCMFPRTVEHLPGMVDITVVFDSEIVYLNEQINISLPVCDLSFIPVEKELELEKRFMEENRKRRSDEIKMLETMQKEYTSRLKIFAENAEEMKKLTKGEVGELALLLDRNLGNVPILMDYVEKNEMWNLFEVKGNL